ncbi:chemotaxis protein [Paraburkholderia azotifigens]|uniref:Chemotaxis protein n=1 Tax=Paraburkholderia azotifigens TaxID=2057004 RepID=A0ABU9R904_9BURK|nr:chemotaxis protein [Paraburkholderia azotifigens]
MSTLNPDDEQRPVVRQTGHDNASLGPSDSSDSGSDMAGAKRHAFDIDDELDNHALETGEAELASDTDRAGTGERASADGDSTLEQNEDIDVDRVISATGEEASEGMAGEMIDGSDEGVQDEGEDATEDEALRQRRK